jgi:hypothetical protein
MVLYTCDNCKKEFTSKCNYIFHINRKYPCKNNNILNNLKCIYCNKYYYDKHTLLRHINKSCKQNKDLNENNLIKLKELELKEKELELKEKELKDSKELKERELELKEKEINNSKELKEKELNLKIIKQKNITNNIINNNTKNNTYNIKIVAFGDENLENIPNEKIKSFINRGFMSVIQMVNYLNCNKDLPENNNIYISNKREDDINLYNGDKWIIQEKDNILNTILNKNGDFLEKKYDEFYDELNEMAISKFKQFMNGRYNEEQIEFMKDKLNKLLYNNRDIFLKNNSIKNKKKIYKKNIIIFNNIKK